MCYGCTLWAKGAPIEVVDAWIKFSAGIGAVGGAMDAAMSDLLAVEELTTDRKQRKRLHRMRSRMKRAKRDTFDAYHDIFKAESME